MPRTRTPRSYEMAAIEIREAVPDVPPPIYRHHLSGSRSGSYRSVAAVDQLDPPPGLAEETFNCYQLTLRFLLTNKLNLLLASNLVLLLASASTLSVLSVLAHGRGFAPHEMPPIICGGENNETCSITATFLPPVLPTPLIDPDDLDAVALHELTRRELFRTIKRAVRDTFLKPGNDTSIIQIFTRELTAHLESLGHPESGK